MHASQSNLLWTSEHLTSIVLLICLIWYLQPVVTIICCLMRGKYFCVHLLYFEVKKSFNSSFSMFSCAPLLLRKPLFICIQGKQRISSPCSFSPAIRHPSHFNTLEKAGKGQPVCYSFAMLTLNQQCEMRNNDFLWRDGGGCSWFTGGRVKVQ